MLIYTLSDEGELELRDVPIQLNTTWSEKCSDCEGQATYVSALLSLLFGNTIWMCTKCANFWAVE